MKHSLLLFLSAGHLHAQHMAGGQIAVTRDFVDSVQGREEFAFFLKSVNCTVYLLTDLIEEDFRHELVPHLIGRKRAALLKRKFDQYYRSTPFRQAILLHRQKTGRRDDDILFSALTNPSLITTWVDIILAQQIPLAGIFSVPQISAPLVKNSASDHVLLVTWERFSGLRQTYFSNHHLQISRLTPVHADLTFHDAVLRELARTYQYLKSLSLLPSDQTLDVLILCHSDDLKQLQEKLPETADMRYNLADISDIGRQLKLDYHFTDSDASQIFLHYLAAHPPKNNYANSTHTHFHSLVRFRAALYLASGIILTGALLWSADNYMSSRQDARETAELNAMAQQTMREVKQITGNFPNTYAPAGDMKAGVTVMRKLKQYSPSPLDIMQPISSSLDRYPRIQLDELSWQMSANEPVASNTLADVPAQVVILKGRMLDFANDYRAALNYLESFERDLGEKGYQVTVLTKPFDASPSGSIADQHVERSDTLTFSVRISRRPGNTETPDINRPPA
ncbi:MAG: hypothetical protein ACOY9D_06845 [Pseudomonadota bacterium]